MNTNKHEKKNPDSIIDLLKKDYLSSNKKNLDKKKGEIVQDHINRGFFNSTVCLSKQLGVHYDHIESLIDYLLESLKRDFPNISLVQCKERLYAIVEEEYRILNPFANQFLINAGLASESILKSFEIGIAGKKEDTKKAVETKIAIIEEQKLANAETIKKKPWYKKLWPYIAAIVFLLVSMLAIIWYVLDLKERIF